jgi:hypothetical protein
MALGPDYRNLAIAASKTPTGPIRRNFLLELHRGRRDRPEVADMDNNTFANSRTCGNLPGSSWCEPPGAGGRTGGTE